MKNLKKIISAVACLCLVTTSGLIMTGCSEKAEKEVIFYSNADDEAVASMKATLDENGYKGKYVFRSFGTSELGGKLLAEGKDIEADVVTMSSYYMDSAQEKHKMFKDRGFDINTNNEFPSYYAPFLANQGAILVNTDLMKKNNLPMPKSVKDLANPVYKGHISMIDIQGSSTAWLMIQSLVSEYGEDGAQAILKDIYKNAGVHIEQSGSGPIKKLRAGEVAIGFGLRHQAVSDKKTGLPIDFIDPLEGSFTLTESLGVVDKGDKTSDLAKDMVKCIVEKGRPSLMEYYPVPIYKGEKSDSTAISIHSKVFKEALTVELLEKHKKFSENSKSN